ncbi:response regulator transcription factor [Phaeodactylibacter luteus]|uniref:Response regulator transcription factor n=1 Tax=Phaeodactylibacter luteus TaxID=1564516 RepID=A0A5C6S4P4_9BACT|nr:response regulator transcription factor [Phaeodactylibacter luteus]TXB69425.1 response regulator transcription factor [Phaeodactylibacter luteus]
MKPVPVILADNQHVFRAGLRHLVEQDGRFIVVAEANEEGQLWEVLEKHPAEVLILDYQQEPAFSIGTVERLRKDYPGIGILIISDDSDKNEIYKALHLGINSFLTKSCDEEEIQDAIRATVKKEKFFCTRVLDYLIERSLPGGADEAASAVSCEPTPLTPREIEIVQLVARGLIAKEIARELNLSTHTIYTHRKNIMKKLGLGSSSELVLYAVNMGLVPKN